MPRWSEANRYCAHYDRAWAMYLRDDYDGVLASAAQMAELDPDASGPMYLHAIVAYARRDYAESLRLCNEAIARDPEYYEYHDQAAEAALGLDDLALTLHHLRAGLACSRIPPLRALVFTINEVDVLLRLARPQEATERLTSLDAHPVILALHAASPPDEFRDVIAALDGEDTPSEPQVNDLIRLLTEQVMRIAAIWIFLGEDRGGSNLRALLQRQPDRYNDVERFARHFKLDARRRALYGLPDPHTCTAAPVPATYTIPPDSHGLLAANARTTPLVLGTCVNHPDPHSLLDPDTGATDLVPERCVDPPSPAAITPDAQAPEERRDGPVDDLSERHRASEGLVVPAHADPHRVGDAARPGVQIAAPKDLLADPADPRPLTVDQRASLLIELLRGRFEELTFGDLHTLLGTRLGEGLAERRLRELLPSAGESAEPEQLRGRPRRR